MFFLILPQAYGQKTDKYFDKADRFYQEEKYDKAVKFYGKIVGSADYNEKAYLQCARCYEKIQEYDKADKLYSQVFVKSKSVDPEVFLEYGTLLMKLGRNGEARSYFMSYNNLMEKNDLRVIRNIMSIEDVDKYYKDSSFISIELLPCSSGSEDYNPKIYNDNLYFESGRDYSSSEPLLRDIYLCSTSGKSADKPKKISGSHGGKHELKGFAVARSTGEILRSVKERTPAGDRYVLKRSFISDDGVRFSREETVSVESFGENIFFPTVNHTGEILVFASDAKNGKGGTDLYISYRNAYGYGKPVLLEGFVNTAGNENYPCLLNDSILFFASDGHGGLGGYDIYYADLTRPYSIPANIGFPINSQYDDYGLSLSTDHAVGYFASNRAEERTRTDLYRLELIKVRATGVVTDQTNGNNLKNVAVSYFRPGEQTSEITLADNGKFSLIGRPGGEYYLTVSKEGYETEEFYVSTSDASPAGLYEVNIGKFPVLKISGDSLLQPVKTVEPVVEETLFVEETIKDTLPPEPEPEPEAEAGPATGTVFRLQIAASRIPLDEPFLRKIYKGPRDIFMFREEGWYKYAIGDFSSYYKANAVRKQCGVKGAFIAAYEDNSKLELMTAIREVHAIPAELRSRSAEVSGTQNIVNNTTIYFPFDRYMPVRDELSKLDALLKTLTENESYQVEIDGHTDIQGSKDYNYGLAAERAGYIREYLVGKGINRNRIRILSFGEKKPSQFCPDNCTSAIHEKNRRVEVYILNN
ncbi:MAG: OmpA family protein [Bacteroidales bacterium]|jgi:outer membrane protein OmpA-like peptidoglycan-associated protein/tetratricopeptide (TPR) repeat protein